MSCNFREQSKIVRTGGIPLWGEPNQTSPLTSPPTQASALASVFGLFATWGKPEPARITRQTEAPRTGAKIRGEGGVIAVWYNLRTGWWIPAKFGTEMANAILFISYLDKIRLTLTGNLWRALACLYSEVRLYKGARTAAPPQSAASHSTGNISVGVKKVGHSNTRGTVSSFVPFPPKYCCTIVYIFNIFNAD
jgi:hypothetical protein